MRTPPSVKSSQLDWSVDHWTSKYCVLPTALASKAIDTVAAPDEHELIEVSISNVISQSTVREVADV